MKGLSVIFHIGSIEKGNVKKTWTSKGVVEELEELCKTFLGMPSH